MANQADTTVDTQATEAANVTIENVSADDGGSFNDKESDAQPQAVPEKVEAKGKATKEAGPKLQDGPATPEQTTATGETAYTPNYKFKAYDKEHEFPKWLQESIKSKEQEEELRTIHAKAFALDDLKEKYGKVQEYRNKYETVEKNIQKLEKYLNSGDVETFFTSLGYNEKQTVDMLSRYVMEKLNYKEMDEDSRKKYDQANMDRRKAMEYEDELKSYKSRLEDYETRQLDTELTMTMSEPEVADIVKLYDERYGKPGSFREQVIELGDKRSRTTGRTVSPREIVNEFAGSVKKLIGPVQQDAGQSFQQQTQVKKPVIPNISGKATSPTKKGFSSIADLEKYVEDRWGN